MESHSCVPVKIILVLKSTSFRSVVAIPVAFINLFIIIYKKLYNHGLINVTDSCTYICSARNRAHVSGFVSGSIFFFFFFWQSSVTLARLSKPQPYFKNYPRGNGATCSHTHPTTLSPLRGAVTRSCR